MFRFLSYSRIARSMVSLILLVSSLAGGTSGKITGKVSDEANGAPLLGVNVILGGLALGASTDANGIYIILNVPPGNYSLKFSMIGYREVIATDVLVNIDLTTTVDMTLSSQSIELGELVVVAPRPAVIPDVAGSRIDVREETILRLPVTSVNEVIGLQAGITGLSIRGSGSYETLFMVDGVALTDERSNSPFTNVSLSGIKEVVIQAGGFSAKYGNARSGIINVVTKDGEKDRYSATATFRYKGPAPKQFGGSVYDTDSYFLRPYMDDDVAWTGTSNGAWDEYTQAQYPRFNGFNAISEASLADEDPANDLTPSGAQRLFIWEHRRQGDIQIPDYTADFGIGGPLPILGRLPGRPRFYLTHRQEQDAFLYPLSRDSYNENMTQMKVTVDLAKGMKLNTTFQYGEIHSVNTASWRTAPTGTYVRSDNTLAALVSGSLASSALYMPGYFNPLSIYRSIASAALTHILSERTYYDVTVKWMNNRYDGWRTADRNLAATNEIVPGYFVDEAPFGYYGYEATSMIDGMNLGGWMGFAQDSSVNKTISFRTDVTSQVRPAHLLTTGLEIIYNDLRIHSANVNPGNDFWNQRLDYDRSPYRIGAYLQDKIEIFDFIMTLGLRYDLSTTNGTWYSLEDYDALFTSEAGDSLEAEAPGRASDPRAYLSPRLAVSHPITTESKLYFNYGHFNQLPQNDFRFKIDRIGNGAVSRIGNPDLPESRTIAYEVGYEHNLFDEYLLKLAGYYKDITDQPSWTLYQSFDNKVSVLRATTDSYQDTRGVELTLLRQSPGWLSGFVNYTYMVSTSGQFGYRAYYEDPNRQREELILNPVQSKPKPRPFARANINLNTPTDFGPRLMGLRPLAGWNANLLGTWQAGSFFTYNPGALPGISDNVQWKPSYNLNMRLSRSFDLGSVGAELFADVTNVLNLRLLRGTVAFSSSNDFIAYMESLHLPDEEGAENGNDQPGDVRPTDVDFRPIETLGSPSDELTPASRAIYYSTTGEQYSDDNGNGSWDEGEDFTDLNGNGAYEAGNTYWLYDETTGWSLATRGFIDEIHDNRAYIDMPNYGFFTFLNPRSITIGLRFNF